MKVNSNNCEYQYHAPCIVYADFNRKHEIGEKL